MRTVTREQLARTTQFRHPERIIAYVYDSVIGGEPPDEIPIEEAMIIWVADIFYQLDFLGHEVRMMLLKRIADRIEYITRQLIAGKEGEHFMLTFADNHYVMISGWESWWDFQGLGIAEELPRPALELVTYSLNELYNRRIVMLDNATSSKQPDAHAVS